MQRAAGAGKEEGRRRSAEPSLAISAQEKPFSHDACGAAARSARVRWVALAGIAANVFTVRSLRDIATRAGVCWAVRATLSPSLGGCFDPGARLISRLGRPDSEEARLLGKVGRRCHQRPPPLSPLLSLLRVTPPSAKPGSSFPARRFGNSGSEVPCPATLRAGAARVRDSRRCGCLLRPVRATPFVWAGHSHPGTRAPESADGATQVLLTTRRNARTAAVRASPQTARSGRKVDMWKHG